MILTPWAALKRAKSLERQQAQYISVLETGNSLRDAQIKRFEAELKGRTEELEKLSKDYADQLNDLQVHQHIRSNQKQMIRTLRAALGFFESLDREPPMEGQVLGALGLADDDTPWWRAVVHVLRRQITEDTNNALRPDLGNEAAHFNRGRAAGLVDHLETLLQLRAKARQPERTAETERQ